MDELIVRARDILVDPETSAEKRVHEARKRFKETRALIHLIRKPLGDQFAHENAWYRDAGRELAAARDADAMVAALEKLEFPARTKQRARKVLDAQRADHPPLDPLIADVVDQLVVAHGRVGMWPELDDSFETIADGLLRTYRDGRRDLQQHETPEELHDWRKRVKEHWYHVQLLRHVWPDMMKPYAEVLSTLSHALGDHHDLHVLRDRLEKAGRFGPTLKVIDERQDKLQREAEEIGARVYAEKPRAWLARMRKYWDSWPRTAH